MGWDMQISHKCKHYRLCYESEVQNCYSVILWFFHIRSVNIPNTIYTKYSSSLKNELGQYLDFS